MDTVRGACGRPRLETIVLTAQLSREAEVLVDPVSHLSNVEGIAALARLLERNRHEEKVTGFVSSRDLCLEQPAVRVLDQQLIPLFFALRNLQLQTRELQSNSRRSRSSNRWVSEPSK